MITEKEIACLLINNDAVFKCDAIVLLEGDGFARVNKTVELYQQGFAPTVVFSGGIENKDYGSYPAEYLVPQLVEKGIPSNAIIIEGKPMHTREQAVEFVKLAKAKNWTSFLLVASNFHQYRAYLTFLKEILLEAPELLMINASANDLPWFEENPWGKRSDLLVKEFEKIEQYRSSNHMATWEEVITYQQWKEKKLLSLKQKKS